MSVNVLTFSRTIRFNEIANFFFSERFSIIGGELIS